MSNLKDAFLKLSILAEDLNLNLSRVSNSNNYSRPSHLQQNANEMWKILSPVMCGSPYTEAEEKDGHGGSSIPELLEGNGETNHALRVMLYMLTHDPMILYSPNGTDADKVVRKVSWNLLCSILMHIHKHAWKVSSSQWIYCVIMSSRYIITGIFVLECLL